MFWWGGADSNHRRHKPTDLQSAPFGRFGTSPPHSFGEKTIQEACRIVKQFMCLPDVQKGEFQAHKH